MREVQDLNAVLLDSKPPCSRPSPPGDSVGKRPGGQSGEGVGAGVPSGEPLWHMDPTIIAAFPSPPPKGPTT